MMLHSFDSASCAMEHEDWLNVHRLFAGPELERCARVEIDSDMTIAQAIDKLLDFKAVEDNVKRHLLPGGSLDSEEVMPPPDQKLREWSAACLPISEQAASLIGEVSSWKDLYGVIFSDTKFLECISSANAFVKKAHLIIDASDLSAVYKLFLGRPPEFNCGSSSLIGSKLNDYLLAILGSVEFQQHTQSKVFIASPTLSSWDVKTLRELGSWAACRLCLSSRAKNAALAAETRQFLLFIILSDHAFWTALGQSLLVHEHSVLPVQINIQAMIVESSMLFEHDGYLLNYPNVAASGVSPLIHYLNYGVAESTNPSRAFDTRWYLSAYPEVRLQPVSPLVHYIMVGAKLGYKPHPFFPEQAELRIGTIDDAQSTPLRDYLDRFTSTRDGVPFFSRDTRMATEANYVRHQVRSLEAHVKAMPLKPVFVIFCPAAQDGGVNGAFPEFSSQIYKDFSVARTLADVRVQAGSVADDRRIAVMWLAPGDRLADNALYEFAARLNADPKLDLIYADEEIVSEDGVCRPFYKPDWSPEYLESCNYIGGSACVMVHSALVLIEKSDCQYEWLLRVTEKPFCRVSHIRKTLLSTERDLEARSLPKSAEEIEAIRGRLSRTGRRGSPEAIWPSALAYRNRVALQRAPLVSLVIPTAAKTISYDGQRIDLIKSCISSISSSTHYSNFEYVVIDNGDFDRSRLDGIARQPIKFLTYEGDEVNIARKINLGGKSASGEYVLILNDDVVPLNPDWISNMLAHFEKPHVGIVGAKLVYPSGLIQHSGMVSCEGVPLHVDRFAPGDEPGYFFGRAIARNFLAVTGAVTMVRRQLFLKLGGYDETFPIDFNDVDFAYRVGADGYQVVYEPDAKLIHYESVSAVKPPRPWDRHNFERRWAHIATDPFYNEYCLTTHPATSIVSYSERRN